MSLSFRLHRILAHDKWYQSLSSTLMKSTWQVLFGKELFCTFPNAFRFFNEVLAKKVPVPRCNVPIDFLYVFVLCFLLVCMTHVQIVPCPAFPTSGRLLDGSH